MTDLEQDHFYKTIGELIKNARKKANLKQEALADMLKLNRSSIVNIEKGRQHPPIHILWELAKSLNSEISALIPSYNPSEKIDQEMKRLVSQQTRGDKQSKEKLINFIEVVKSSSKS